MFTMKKVSAKCKQRIENCRGSSRNSKQRDPSSFNFLLLLSLKRNDHKKKGREKQSSKILTVQVNNVMYWNSATVSCYDWKGRKIVDWWRCWWITDGKTGQKISDRQRYWPLGFSTFSLFLAFTFLSKVSILYRENIYEKVLRTILKYFLFGSKISLGY